MSYQFYKYGGNIDGICKPRTWEW